MVLTHDFRSCEQKNKLAHETFGIFQSLSLLKHKICFVAVDTRLTNCPFTNSSRKVARGLGRLLSG